ncbi:hypothetical protein PgNI_10097 [Pyricularia grisea]|uniref:Uncharacterized protein n=1 Tax=Pyricularia grisea TaxID=148305 RepID=A0A6P8AZ14_PYRGI|nr:hypothetical protein PgNI_10097 [Pyricularia grisea]TLD07539.1 hypothetical protein PgNI_10097 [Pyricularia grisea]
MASQAPCLDLHCPPLNVNGKDFVLTFVPIFGDQWKDIITCAASCSSGCSRSVLASTGGSTALSKDVGVARGSCGGRVGGAGEKGEGESLIRPHAPQK